MRVEYEAALENVDPTRNPRFSWRIQTDVNAYRERAEHVLKAFNDLYFDAEVRSYGPGTQSSYSVPLFLGMVPDERVDEVAANLAEKVRADGGKLKTGFLGTRPLIHTLANHGHADLAYEVVTQPEWLGWMYMVRSGATTMWEDWDSDERVGDRMNSFNHSPFTHVSEFFYEVLAGIRIGDPHASNSNRATLSRRGRRKASGRSRISSYTPTTPPRSKSKELVRSSTL